MVTQQEFLDDLASHLNGFRERLVTCNYNLASTISSCKSYEDGPHVGEADPDDIVIATNMVTTLDGLISAVEEEVEVARKLAYGQYVERKER